MSFKYLNQMLTSPLGRKPKGDGRSRVATAMADQRHKRAAKRGDGGKYQTGLRGCSLAPFQTETLAREDWGEMRHGRTY